MEETSKIVEINGIKMELDLRTAKLSRVDTFKVGDPVKLLYKQYDTSTPELKYGVIVGFDEFKTQPTITIAYLDYSDIKYAYINSNSKHEMIAVQKHDLKMDKTWVIKRMEDGIETKRRELQQAESRLQCFVETFGKYFQDGIPEASSN